MSNNDDVMPVGRVAEVIVMFEDSVLGVHYLRAGQRFGVGASTVAQLCWPIEGDAAESVVAPVRVSPSGAIELVDVPTLQASIALVDDPAALVFARELDGGARVTTLVEAARARIAFDQVSLLVSYTEAPRRRPLPPPVDLQAHVSTAAVALVFALFVALASAIPPLGQSLSLDPFALDGPIAHIELVPHAVPAAAGSALDATAAASAAPTGPRTPKPRPHAATITNASAPTHAQTTAQRRDAAAHAAESAGILGVFAANDYGQIGSVFGPSSAIGDGAGAVMGTLDGSLGGGGGGSGGTGTLVEGGHGGRGDGTVGLGHLASLCHSNGCGGGGAVGGYGRGAGGLTGLHVGAPDPVPGTAKVVGSIDKELIRRVVRHHLNEVKYCYEQELQRHPKLDGRVVVGFMISANGTVVSSSVKESSMNDATVDTCVASAVRRWEFTKQMGLSLVTYPFTFHPAGT